MSRKIPQWTSRKQYLHGDLDGDGIPNVDDKYPARKGDDHRVNPELSLSEELKEYDKVHDEAKQELKNTMREVDADLGRVKHPISIMRKLRKKHIEDVKDLIGVMIIAEDREDVHRTARELKSRYGSRVVADKNYYSDLREDGYRARHLIIDKGKYQVEVQIKTPPMKKIADKAHLAYKMGDVQAERKYKVLFDKAAQRGY